MEDYILDDSLFDELIKMDFAVNSRKNSFLETSEQKNDEQKENVPKEDGVRIEKEDDDVSGSQNSSLLSKPENDVQDDEKRKRDIVEDFVEWLIKDHFAERVYTKYRSTLWGMDRETESKLNRSIILEEDEKEIGSFQELFVNKDNRTLTASVIKYFKRYKASLRRQNVSAQDVSTTQVVAHRKQKKSGSTIAILPRFRKWLADEGFSEEVIDEYVNILSKYDKAVSLSSGNTLLGIREYKKIISIVDMLNKRKRLTNKERVAFKSYASFIQQL